MAADSYFVFHFNPIDSNDSWVGYTYGDTTAANVGTQWVAGPRANGSNGGTYTILVEQPLGYDVSDYYGAAFNDWQTFVFQYHDWETNTVQAPYNYSRGFGSGPMGFESDYVYLGGGYQQFGHARAASSLPDLDDILR